MLKRCTFLAKLLEPSSGSARLWEILAKPWTQVKGSGRWDLRPNPKLASWRSYATSYFPRNNFEASAKKRDCHLKETKRSGPKRSVSPQQALTWRHREFVLRHNAQLDSKSPKPKHQLISELEKEEKARNGGGSGSYSGFFGRASEARTSSPAVYSGGAKGGMFPALFEEVRRRKAEAVHSSSSLRIPPPWRSVWSEVRRRPFFFNPETKIGQFNPPEHAEPVPKPLITSESVSTSKQHEFKDPSSDRLRRTDAADDPDRSVDKPGCIDVTDAPYDIVCASDEEVPVGPVTVVVDSDSDGES